MIELNLYWQTKENGFFSCTITLQTKHFTILLRSCSRLAQGGEINWEYLLEGPVLVR